MQTQTLQREQWVPKPLAEVFSFFCEARNLNRITPPWLHFRVQRQTGYELSAGTLIYYRLTWHGIPLTWTSRIEDWRPSYRFVDVQLNGPYKFWHHTHSFEPFDGGTLISDSVSYALPYGLLGEVCAGRLVRRDVDRIFNFRARKIAEIFREQPAPIHMNRKASC